MNKRSDSYKALKWLTDVLNCLDIPYQIVGGLAARCYGSTRPLHAIDQYVPGKDLLKLENELAEYIVYGPVHHQDEHWDLVFMKLSYKGQKIEIGDANNTNYFDSSSKRWIKEKINFLESNMLEIEGITLLIMPKQDLIKYKERLNRNVDRIDIEEMQNEI